MHSSKAAVLSTRWDAEENERDGDQGWKEEDAGGG